MTNALKKKKQDKKGKKDTKTSILGEFEKHAKSISSKDKKKDDKKDDDKSKTDNNVSINCMCFVIFHMMYL